MLVRRTYLLVLNNLYKSKFIQFELIATNKFKRTHIRYVNFEGLSIKSFTNIISICIIFPI